jgi:hypothetical protein
MINRGQIELGSKVIVSDPCYDLDTWCLGILDNVLPGTYNCSLYRSDKEPHRVSSIYINHNISGNVLPMEKIPFSVGVDSGQAGFFDYPYFIQTREGKEDENWGWYDDACELTFSKIPNPLYKEMTKSTRPIEENFTTKEEFMKALIKHVEDDMEYFFNEMHKTLEIQAAATKDNKCFISASGYGDGEYDCYVGRDKSGQIVSAMILFIDDSVEEKEE